MNGANIQFPIANTIKEKTLPGNQQGF